MLDTADPTGQTTPPEGATGMAICDACRHDLQALLEELYGLQVIEAEAAAGQIELRQRIDAALDAALTETRA